MVLESPSAPFEPETSEPRSDEPLPCVEPRPASTEASEPPCEAPLEPAGAGSQSLPVPVWLDPRPVSEPLSEFEPCCEPVPCCEPDVLSEPDCSEPDCSEPESLEPVAFSEPAPCCEPVAFCEPDCSEPSEPCDWASPLEPRPRPDESMPPWPFPSAWPSEPLMVPCPWPPMADWACAMPGMAPRARPDAAMSATVRETLFICDPP